MVRLLYLLGGLILFSLVRYYRPEPLDWWVVQDVVAALVITVLSTIFAGFIMNLLAMRVLERYNPLERTNRGGFYNSAAARIQIDSSRLTEYSWRRINEWVKARPNLSRAATFFWFFCLTTIYLGFTAK